MKEDQGRIVVGKLQILSNPKEWAEHDPLGQSK